MLNLIVGLGVQGNKRLKHLQNQKSITLDPFNKKSDFSNLNDIDLSKVTHAYVCTPENQKFKIIEKLLKKKVNVLVEKPLFLTSIQEKIILRLLSKKKSTLYTAYNHRFEPHIVNVKRLLKKKIVGKVYNINLYYGNGTARLWKNSWREKNNFSILHDLGVHLMDIFNLWFGYYPTDFKRYNIQKNELKCFDYFSFGTVDKKIKASFTTSVINWRNTFKADILGSKGSIHIDCLCKWGPSELIIRTRKFPSGKPTEKIRVLKQSDPTWALEEKFFKKISRKKLSNFINDIKIKKSIRKI